MANFGKRKPADPFVAVFFAVALYKTQTDRIFESLDNEKENIQFLIVELHKFEEFPE